jgi:RNA polymerase sigma factor (sigma-70 family)
MAYYFDELIVSELRKENNATVLRELYRTHYPMIVNLVCSNNGTEQEAKDVYQESLIAFYEKIRSPGFVLTCKIKTYLYAVCRRLWLKRLSEKKRFSPNIDAGETFAEIDDEMLTIEDTEKKFAFMGQSLNGLGEPCRSIIEDFYVHDLSMEAIRDKHGYTSTENAKNQKYKCLQRLKKIFFSHYHYKTSS